MFWLAAAQKWKRWWGRYSERHRRLGWRYQRQRPRTNWYAASRTGFSASVLFSELGVRGLGGFGGGVLDAGVALEVVGQLVVDRLDDCGVAVVRGGAEGAGAVR